MNTFKTAIALRHHIRKWFGDAVHITHSNQKLTRFSCCFVSGTPFLSWLNLHWSNKCIRTSWVNKMLPLICLVSFLTRFIANLLTKSSWSAISTGHYSGCSVHSSTPPQTNYATLGWVGSRRTSMEYPAYGYCLCCYAPIISTRFNNWTEIWIFTQ